MGLVLQLLLNGLVVWTTARVVPGVRVSGFGSAVWVAGVYGLLALLLKQALVMLSLPLVVVTFGLFLLVLNGFLLWLTDKILSRFEIRNLAALTLATLSITLGFTLVDVVLGLWL